MEGLSAAEAVLLSDNNRRDGFMGDDMWGFLMFALIFGWGGNGFGFGGNRNGGCSDCATKSDVSNGFALNGLNNGIDNLKTGQFGIETSIANATAGLQSSIANLGYQLQQCCCATERAVDGVNYNMAMNTCTITNAIKDSTSAILGYLTNEKITALQTELQSAQLALQNNAQTQTLIEALRPTSRPAYITCSPYEAANYGNHFFNGYNAYNNGYNNSCGCGCGC